MRDDQTVRPETGTHDRRTSRRCHSNARIRFRFADECVGGYLYDLSRTGVKLIVDTCPMAGQKASIEVDGGLSFVAEASLVWCKVLDSGQFNIGCQLDKRLLLKQYLALCDFALYAQQLEDDDSRAASAHRLANREQPSP